MIDRKALRGFLDEAVSLVSETVPLIQRHFAEGFSSRLKEDQSPVTDIDLAVEKHLRAGIEARFPEHGVLGEEYGTSRPSSDFQWIIDPIDGTISLKHRVPLFGTILSLAYEGEPVLGIISLPMLGRLCAGANGLGATLNGAPMKLQDVASREAARDEIVSTGDRKQFAPDNLHVFDRLFRSHAVTRTYTDVFGHVLALEGAVGAMVDFDMRPWDAAATGVLVREVGGRYERLNLEKGGRADRHDAVFGKPAVVDYLLELLSTG